MILDDTKETMVPMDTEPENGDYKGEDGLLSGISRSLYVYSCFFAPFFCTEKYRPALFTERYFKTKKVYDIDFLYTIHLKLLLL